MPAFAFTVGSLGDFIALGDLVVKIGVALYKPGECTKDFEDLQRELEQYSQILSKMEVLEGQKRTPKAENCLKMIQTQVDRTRQAMKEFLDKERQTSGGVWDKVMWVTNGPSEMAELRRTLSAHREMLSYLLEM
jgi:hypothetical protein